MKITRIYSDESGESHFDEIDINFSSVDFAPPAPPLDLSEISPASKYGFLRAPADWVGDWHPAPRRMIFCYLRGEVDAEVSDGEIRRFGPGDVTMVEDTTGKGHISKSTGPSEILLVMIQLDK